MSPVHVHLDIAQLQRSRRGLRMEEDADGDCACYCECDGCEEAKDILDPGERVMHYVVVEVQYSQSCTDVIYYSIVCPKLFGCLDSWTRGREVRWSLRSWH